MAVRRPYVTLRCTQCFHAEQVGVEGIQARLLQLGMLKRADPSDVAFLVELLRSAARRLSCAECGQLGLQATERLETTDDWPEGRLCEGCGQPIGRERLELFPDSRLCVDCQRSEERGPAHQSAEYCPRCGELMQLRAGRAGGGVTRYAYVCPQCGR